MKLTIEINDDALRNAVEVQVSQQVAKLATAAIEQKAQQIIETRLTRFNPDEAVVTFISTKVNERIEKLINEAFSSYYSNRNLMLRDLVAAEARKMLAEAVKK